jgi:Ferroportin1 (FPN1)
MKHDVRNAGLALSFLYMTVLGFDNITWGYSLMQCVTESVLGMYRAVLRIRKFFSRIRIRLLKTPSSGSGSQPK